jgi:ABC-type cobalamin/Fe3+-siderophores transport system ATPase subunit
MQKFITDIKVNYVRNLNERNISVSETHLKHLVMTGKNGSGKSSLLDACKSRPCQCL